MPTMGRKPTVNLNLPPRMRARVRGAKTYYFYDIGGKPRKELSLGSDYILAIKKWADLEADDTNVIASQITFKFAADKYRREVIPTKAARTQVDNLVELENLLQFFNDPPALLSDIKPIHIRKYLDWRTDAGTKSTVRANRERALFSHIWNKAREWDFTDRDNPCRGITGYTEVGRDIYIEDQVFNAVHSVACQPLQDALDLAYLTGQRPSDTLKISETDIREGMLMIGQSKTGKKLRIAIEGHLQVLIDRILKRKQGLKVRCLALVCTPAGRPLTWAAMRIRFDKARLAAAKANPKLSSDIMAFQFRDLRAKAGTDKADSTDMHQAQKQLGHGSMKMTEHYVRSRLGDKVKPTK